MITLLLFSPLVDDDDGHDLQFSFVYVIIFIVSYFFQIISTTLNINWSCF